MLDKMKINRLLSPLCEMKYRMFNKKRGWIYIGKHCKVVNPSNITYGSSCQVASYSLLCAHGDSVIEFGNNVNIGMFSRIACINRVKIGDDVLTGPHIFISDYNHSYEDVSLPICKQGNTPAIYSVVIDDGSWIGTNAVICGNVHIGKHSVIGANTFVNKDIPSYCVAVGNPARIVKKYNFSTNTWDRVSLEK